jgi:hypothetical protein
MKKIFSAFFLVVICVINIQSQEFKGLKSYVDGTYNPSDKSQVDELVKYFTWLIKDGKIKVYNEGFTDSKNNDRALNLDEFNSLITKYDTTTEIDPVMLDDRKIIIGYENYNIEKIRLVSETHFDEKINKMTSEVKKIDFMIPALDGKTKEFLGYAVRFYILL